MSDRRPNSTRQLKLIHLSDIHFGKSHRFDPPPTPRGDIPPRVGYPMLLDKLLPESSHPDPGCPVGVCITGDLATSHITEELQQAEEFLLRLSRANLYGSSRGLDSIFLVPGNHDVVYDGSTFVERWRPWTDFYNRLYGTRLKPSDPWATVLLHDRVRDLGAFFLCINSAIHVQKGKEDEIRGNVDYRQLKAIRNALEAIPPKKMRSAIRVALIHHHPVLIPALAEPGRGYDAVHNSGALLNILHQFGFHLILHGHKHNPHTFTDDTRSGFSEVPDSPIFIAAGGSIGSRDLPDLPKRCNCYNRITIKWHPEAMQTRIVVETRGLSVYGRGGSEKLPDRWRWFTLDQVDRNFSPGQPLPDPKTLAYAKFDETALAKSESKRRREYERTRGNLPVVEVLPSLVPRQAYEARVWIVGHQRKQTDAPVQVTWSCGKRFPTVTIRREQDDRFCTAFNYWGPMLVQANLRFSDGSSVLTCVYARMPEDYSSKIVR